jgi:hypothetical protein
VPLEYVSLTINDVPRHSSQPHIAEDAIPLSWAKRILTLQYIDLKFGRRWLNEPPRQCWVIERKATYVTVQAMDSIIGAKTREFYKEVAV